MENPVSEQTQIRSPHQDPRVLISSAGLILAYTVRQVGQRFVHHYSVSVSGGYTARAAGETFVLLTAWLIGVPYERLSLSVGRSTVHHAAFELSHTENEALRAREVPPLSPADIAAFRKEWMSVRDRLSWRRE
jgi:hypothetical protein